MASGNLIPNLVDNGSTGRAGSRFGTRVDACGDSDYIRHMSIGTRLFTFLHGTPVGTDAQGNRYFREKKPRGQGLRERRWVMFNGPEEASVIPPEWHAWIHHTTDAPLDETHRKPWQKPHLPNLTGTTLSYRPPGHDYQGGHRAAATGDYEAWTPDA